MPRDFRAALAASRAISSKTSGDTGDSGDTGLAPEGKAGISAVTTAESELVTVVTAPVAYTGVTTRLDALVTVSGDGNNYSNQRVTDAVTTVTSVTTQNVEEEERSAIMEHDAGMPREWADAFAAIVHGPVRFPEHPAQWQSVLDGALMFADRWAGKAHSLGWTVDELFGLDPVAPASRLDHRGLAFLLANGSQVVAIDKDGADIRTGRGARHRYYRQRRSAA